MADGGFPSRPRAWEGATLVNKWPTGGKGWIARNTSGGEEMHVSNRGGEGEGYTDLHAFTDYVDNGGAHRPAFIPGAQNWSLGVSVGSSFPPMFARAVESAESLFGEVYFVSHLDNSGFRIYSSYFNPRDRRRKRGDLSRGSMPVCDSTEGGEGGAEMGRHRRGFLLDATRKDTAMFLTTAPGERVGNP